MILSTQAWNLEQSLSDYYAQIAWDKEEEEGIVILSTTKQKQRKHKCVILQGESKGLTSLEDGAMLLPFNDEGQKPEKPAAMMVACLASKQRIHVPICQSCLDEA